MSTENVEKFIGALAASLEKGTFVKFTLGNYKGADAHLQKILARPVETKRGARVFFLYRYETRDTAKNYDYAESVARVRELLGRDFFAAHLFTTINDFQLDLGKKGKSRLNVAKPTFKTRPSAAHNREKQILIDPASFYLQALGITTDRAEVRDKQQDKWKQINKFVETLASLFDNSLLKDRKELRIVDMGSGKGYLTFAAYDYFKNARGLDVTVTGVDTKKQLIELCSDIARSSDFEGLNFVHGYINDFDFQNADVLIALHACNTATDDAIFKGIEAKADLIVVAPCCHQEIRQQIKAPPLLKNVLKHGIMLEREAEILTDGLRSMLLERSGYQTKVFEFVGTEHTPKNNMIVGTRHEKIIEAEKSDREILELKDFYGIKKQHLEELLKANS